MSNVQRTPTPWGVSEMRIEDSRLGFLVAEVPVNHPANEQTQRANAAFIVKAVNSHDALVVALRRITTEYVRTRAQQDGKKMGEDWSEYESIMCVEEARATLAAAGAA